MTFGARPQYGENWEDYEEGSGENDTIMDLLHFGDNENWLGWLTIMRNIHSTHLSSPKNNLKKHTWKRNSNIRDVNQLQTWMQLTSFAFSNFKEMSMQRSTNFSLLNWRQSTHQMHNMDKTPPIWQRFPLFAKKVLTIIKNWCMKTNPWSHHYCPMHKNLFSISSWTIDGSHLQYQLHGARSHIQRICRKHN